MCKHWGALWYFGGLLIACMSCKNQAPKVASKDLQVVSIRDYEKNIIRYADFMTQIDTIPLYTKGYFMGSVKDLCLNDTIMYVLDKSNAIWSFKYPSGDFVKRIQKIGHGNGEYMALSAITLKDTLLYLLDTETRSFLTLDLCLNYKERFNISFIAEDFAKTKDGFLFFNSVKTKDLNSLVHTDEVGRIKDSYIPTKVDIDMWFEDRVFVEDENGNIYISTPFSNEVYKWTANGPEWILQTDFGNNTYTESLTTGSEIFQSNYAFNTTFFITNDYFINSFLQRGSAHEAPWKRYYSFYDRKGKKHLFGQIDLTEIIPFSPSWQYKGNLIGVCNTSELMPTWFQEDSLCEAFVFVYHLKKQVEGGGKVNFNQR